MPSSFPNSIWNVSFLDPGAESRNPLALVVLNQALAPVTFARLWLKCRWRIFADGGSNRVYDAFSPEERLRRKGVPIEQIEDQDSTDLMKCIAWIANVEKSQDAKLDVALLGGLSGRLDHTVHTMSLLHKLRNVHRIFAISNESVGWVLDRVSIPSHRRQKGYLITPVRI
ncbi:thiamin pyrophosphokinase, catalytic domain-containing protein [Rhizoctonia solani AG-1 IA]|uniref:Thiamin pyrophosphokinase, catalytic domain-containing protein n=1 Tax=Thanatephorus cucumeris (strain AG1-IA) TaxID=983506 RepID=L8WXB9_THACA|nr:thiamin pyrophosphokinase, catalytic domain-containing protein [Rhizoctonia solani AG-1 IA]